MKQVEMVYRSVLMELAEVTTAAAPAGANWMGWYRQRYPDVADALIHPPCSEPDSPDWPDGMLLRQQ